MKTENTVLKAATDYLNAGLSIIPTGQNKRPNLSGWKQYQRIRAGLGDADYWFSNGSNLIAMVCGKVSGNLNMIDFDNRGELFDPWCELVESQSPGLCGKLVVEISQSGGRHVCYRCTEITIEGNTKLAQRAYECAKGQQEFELNGKKYDVRKKGEKWLAIVDLIETRGEGGYFLCAPSRGYKLMYGEFTALPIISSHEHEILISSARALNEYVKGPEFTTSTHSEEARQTATDDKPGADFNNRGDIRPLLEREGWTRVKDHGKYEHWCRPGKRGAVSASLIEGKTWWVFSSNGAPFEIEKGYSKFAVFALLNHNGNFTEAAKSLADSGYGKKTAPRAQQEKPKEEQAPVIPLSTQFKQRVADTVSGKYFACGWPWHYLECSTRALLPGTITILCAPKGSSKSFMLIQALQYWWHKGYNPAALMMEDNRLFHATRGLAQYLQRGEICAPEWMEANADESQKLAEEHADFFDEFGSCIHEGQGGWTTIKILQWIKDRSKESKIIAIDPITAKIPTAKPWADDHQFMRSAAEIVDKAGSRLVLVTHPPKSNGQKAAWGDDVAGGMAFQQFSQTILWLEYMATPETMTVANQMGVCQSQVNRVLQLRKTRNAAGQGSSIGFFFDKKTLLLSEQGVIYDG